MSLLLAVQVECYSGHTFAERPMAFTCHGQRHQVGQILKQWHSPDGPGFRVLTLDGAEYELTYSQNQDEWTLHLLSCRGMRGGLPIQDNSASPTGSNPDNPDPKENDTNA
jgi:hypothetical protein